MLFDVINIYHSTEFFFYKLRTWISVHQTLLWKSLHHAVYPKPAVLILLHLHLFFSPILTFFISFLQYFLPSGECGCGCSDVGIVASSTGSVNGPSNGSKTAHTKVATSGGHANTQAPSKRSSSGADGDYHLVQHEVLYSLVAEYEVCLSHSIFYIIIIYYHIHHTFIILLRNACKRNENIEFSI